MELRRADEYLGNLKRQSPEIYARGLRVEDRVGYQPFRSTVRAWGTFLYDSVQDQDLRKHVLLQRSEGTVHCFWHVPGSPEELLASFDATWRIAELSPAASYTRLGRDQLAALLVITRQMDDQIGTTYGLRVREYLESFGSRMTMTAAAMTDAKGDRLRRPSEQQDPDAYLRIVDRGPDGLIVRGSKPHVAGAVAAEEIIVLPGRALREDESSYAISFAIPVDAPGLKLIARDIAESSDPHSAPLSARDAVVDSLVVFDDVFIPSERVFMAGEYAYAGPLATLFADLIRQGYLATDVGRMSGYLGAALLVVEANGVAESSHVRTKLAEMVKLRSMIYAAGVAASLRAHTVEPHVAVPDPILSSAGQQVAREAQYTFLRHLIDLAGAGVITLPAPADVANTSVAPYIEKYFTGATVGRERLQALRLVHDLAASPYAAWWCVETTNRSGSAAAETLQMLREYDFSEHKRLARRLARVD